MFAQISPQIPPANSKAEKSLLKLPIHHFKQDILASIVSNRVTVVSGESGIGKTTQVRNFNFEWSNQM